MTTRIEKDFYFSAALHFEDGFYVNSYDLTLSMLVETDSIHEQNVAMGRINYLLDNFIQNSLFINSIHKKEIANYKKAGITVCALPEEPFDQIVAMILLLKLNAVAEDRLKITDMVISSTMSQGVRFSIVSEIAEELLSGNYWWNSACFAVNNDTDTVSDFNKIIKLFRNDEWLTVGLGWKENGQTIS